MLSLIKKIILVIISVFVLLIISFLLYLFVGFPKQAEDITWGMNFSQKHAENLGLDWKQTYLALLDDLGVRDIRIGVDWDKVELESGKYDFKDIDWQIDEAEKRGVRIILVFGIKTPRWPECHIPGWAKNMSVEENQNKVLDLTREVVLRYKEKSPIWAWQVENEPFFPFGECPKGDKKFLEREIELVKSIDSQRPVIITDSGEMSLWLDAAQVGDIVGVTMYKKVWSKEFKIYMDLLYPSVFYNRKSEIVKKFYNKDVICVELQAEPWTPDLIYNSTLKEQLKTMDLSQFKKNIDFAKSTGLNAFYLWGGEWFYWMKEKNNQPEIWNEAKKLFND